MGSRTLFSSVRSSSPVCGESSSLRRSKAPLVSASYSSRASSSSAGPSSLASMDLALGFLPHKPINKREKGERGLCGKRKRKGRRGNPVVYYGCVQGCVQPPLCTTAVYNCPCTAPHECHTRVSHTRVSHTRVSNKSVRCLRR